MLQQQIGDFQKTFFSRQRQRSETVLTTHKQLKVKTFLRNTSKADL